MRIKGISIEVRIAMPEVCESHSLGRDVSVFPPWATELSCRFSPKVISPLSLHFIGYSSVDQLRLALGFCSF